MHKDFIDWNGQKVQIDRKKFYRRFSIYVKANQSLRVRAAMLVSHAKILEFLDMQKDWIEKSLAKFDEIKSKYPKYQFLYGEKLPLLGYTVELQPTDLKYFYLKEGKLCLPKDKSLRASALKAYKAIAAENFSKRLKHWQDIMQIDVSALKVKTYKARWGACTAKKEISLNWKLVAAPQAIIDYVIIHELSHCIHMNHSKDFWALVAHYCPQYKERRNWLRKHHFYFDFLEEKSELHS